VASEILVPLPNDRDDPFAPTFIQSGPKPHDCGKNNNIKHIAIAKMDEFSKFFRKLFGFEELDLPVFNFRAERHGAHPPVPGPKMMMAHAAPEEDDKTFHILPFMPGPVRGEGFPPPPPPISEDSSSSPHPHPPEFHGRQRMWIHRHRPHSFVGRLHKAFLTLSPWEGRALSFVVGCGIGVLLRMLYVFSVLAYRCFLAQPRLRLEDRQEEERAPAADVTAEEPSSIQTPPPEYKEKGDTQ